MNTTTRTAPSSLPLIMFLLVAFALCLSATYSHARDRDNTNEVMAKKIANDPYYRSTYSRTRESGRYGPEKIKYDQDKDTKKDRRGTHGPWDNDRWDKKRDRDDNKDITWRGSRNVYDYGDGSTVIIRIGDSDRAKIRSYIREDYFQHHCPPGLAKKRNGCTPPGHAKRYEIGKPLPGDAVVLSPPQDLLVLLGPPPRGAYYAQVDQDILLMSESGHHILDAVTLLSAVN